MAEEVRYPHLLSPIRIGDVILKNRTIYPNANPHVFQGPEPFPAEGIRTFYAEVAKNGAALITLADRSGPERDRRKGDPESDMTHGVGWDMGDPANHNYVSQLAEEIHFYGTKILLEMHVGMPEGYTISGGSLIGPPDRGGVRFKQLPVDMMDGVIEEYIRKIRLYRNLGFDGLSMRVDGYLTPTPESFHRDDEYTPDGSVADRTRFIRRVFRAVKDYFGPDFIIQNIVDGATRYGYGGWSKVGHPIGDTIEYIRLVEEDKSVDLIQVRADDSTMVHATGFNFKKGEHRNVAYCEAIKAAGIGLPLAIVGGLQDPAELEGYIAAGKCDMISMARAFIADYDYGQKLLAGKGEEVRPCIWCNKCHGVAVKPDPAPWLVNCSVNPEHGIAHKLHRLVRETTPGKVAVIGGGVAGMQAAITAAERGHDVTLYEKTERLGGQLLHTETYSFKWPIRDYKDWQIRSLDRLGVHVVLNAAPTADEIRAGGFDAVIAATGAEAVRPAIPGAESCPTCADVYMDRCELGKKVVIVGGSETGVETAMHLAEHGHDVTVLTRQAEIAHDASKLHYITMAFVKPLGDGTGRESPAWEMYDNITGITGASVTAIDGGTVTYTDADGEHTIEADSVVINGGVKARVDAAAAYIGTAIRFAAVGDCAKGGNILNCVREAYAAACAI